MVTEIHVPAIETTGVKPSVGRWFKRAVDPVSFDEPLVEIDTDNMTLEIRAPVTGVLSQILVKDGGFVETGTAVGTISQFLPSLNLTRVARSEGSKWTCCID